MRLLTVAFYLRIDESGPTPCLLVPVYLRGKFRWPESLSECCVTRHGALPEPKSVVFAQGQMVTGLAV